MKFTENMRWFEEFLPSPRHRKMQHRLVSGDISVTIPELTSAEAPVSILLNRRSPLDGPSHFGTSQKVEYRWWRKRFYARVRLSHMRVIHHDGTRQRPATINDIYPDSYSYATRKEARKKLVQKIKPYVLIDGKLYREIGEPRYVVVTFGLGCNHGVGWGTCLCVDHSYNPNIHRNRYFRIDQEELARQTGRKIAEDRGDTKAFPHFDKRIYERFEVYIPESLRVKPKRQHGTGDEFMNKVDALTTGKDPVMAGLGALALAFQ